MATPNGSSPNGWGPKDSVTGLPVRAEKMTIGIVFFLAAISGSFYIGSEWADLKHDRKLQGDKIEANTELIKDFTDSVKSVNLNFAALRAQLMVSRTDPWRGEDMREWGNAASKLNPSWSPPDIDLLPGYNKRNANERQVR